MGGGQRTRLFFDALLPLAPTHVLILGDQDAPGPMEFFPGAQSVEFVKVPGFALPSGNALVRQFQVLKRLLFPSHTYRVHPPLAHKVEGLVDDSGKAVVVFRYAKTRAAFCWSAPASPFVVLDVDDRDDLKIISQLKTRLTQRVGGVIGRLVVRPLNARILKIFEKCTLVYFAKDIDHMGGSVTRVATLPNVPFKDPDDARVGIPATAPTILFVGGAGHAPNTRGLRWFLSSCWPAIAKACPDAQMRIVGQGDWSRLAAEFKNEPSVTFVGRVEDVSTEYETSRVVICPIHEGAGSQIKLIEACAHGRPVVSTTLSAQGFGPEIAEVLPAHDTADGFADEVLLLLRDHQRASDLGKSLRRVQQASNSRAGVVQKLQEDIRAIFAAPSCQGEAS
jgi:glycosyltransferase involved in cell wall biosynthesis